VTTIHVLGLDESSGNMKLAYDNALQVPMSMETLEVYSFCLCHKLIFKLDLFSFVHLFIITI
jgi:hypothetical protein